MSHESAFKALVRALIELDTTTDPEAQRKIFNRIAANKKKLMQIHGGMSWDYIEAWDSAKDEQRFARYRREEATQS